MTDIVERLRKCQAEPWTINPDIIGEAAAEIERLRAALREIEFHGGPAADYARRALEGK